MADSRETKLVLEDRIGEFRHALKALQKRARRHKLTAAIVEIGDIACLEWVTYKDWDGAERKMLVRYLPVHILAGEAIKAAGWTFTARLERVGDTHLVHRAPGVEGAPIEERFLARAGGCDHCKSSRQRKDTYIVEHEDGRQMQIGSTCLRDFLGCDSPASLAARFALFSGVRDAFGDEGWEPPTCSLEGYMTLVAISCRQRGFWSRARAEKWGGDERTTAGDVADAAFGSGRDADKAREKFAKLRTDEDAAQAHAIIAYWRALTPTSDYERNLAILCAQDEASAKHGALLASAIAAWARHAGIALGPQKEERPSNHVGEVGKRMKGLTLTITAKFGVSSQWSDNAQVVKMIDDDGNVFAWFTSTYHLAVGHRYTIDATVKAHGKYKDRKETQLTRCTIKERHGAPALEGVSDTAMTEFASATAA